MTAATCRSICLVLLACGCATVTHSQIARELSVEWSCAASQIEITNESSNTLRARGCGKTALYHCSGKAKTEDPHTKLAPEEEHRMHSGTVGECHRASSP